MVLFNYSTRELTAKVVYYGPGLCGKTTNLQYIYESLPDNIKKGKMLSLATKTDRTLFFDFLPLELGSIRGMKTRVQLYTVPGQVFYNSTRKLVLKGADGVVFVADSQSKMLEANDSSYKNLDENLREMGILIDEIPLVMQFNKRDLPNLAAVEEMNTQINRHNAPFYEAVATTGIGVEDTLKAITKLVLNNLATKYKLDGTGVTPDEPAPRRRPAAAPPTSPPPAATPPRPAPPAATATVQQEDLSLDALEIDLDAQPTPVPAPRTTPQVPQPTAGVAPVPAAVPGSPQILGEELLDLEAEIDLQGLDTPPDGSIDLGEDLLQELEEEAGPPPAQTTAVQPSLQVVSPIEIEETEAPINLEEPINLGAGGWSPSVSSHSSSGIQVLDIGPLQPGQERVLEVPVSVTVNGRSVRLNLRVTVRLDR